MIQEFIEQRQYLISTAFPPSHRAHHVKKSKIICQIQERDTNALSLRLKRKDSDRVKYVIEII